MNIRFYNARILSMAPNSSIIEGELHVLGNRIGYIGTAPPTEKYTALHWDREIDAKGNLLMPGFKNAHTHSAMTFLRSFADDLPLLPWLHEKVFPMEAKLTADAVYHLSKLAILEYLTSGITANFDMYMFPDAICKASIDCGFRTVLTSCLSDHSQSIKELDYWFRHFNNVDELIRFRLGFHAEYTTSKPLLSELAKLAKTYKAPVFTHISESKSEVELCRKRTGLTPPAYLEKLGIFEYGGGGYHCVHLTEMDMELFKKHKLYVITNPASNAKLASGIAPIERFIQLGIPIGIGTDGPASNNCLDMFREMFLTTALAKLRGDNASAVDAEAVLSMACVNGAKAMGLDDCDTLEEDKLADIILLDLWQPNMQPIHHIKKNIVYAGSKQNVILTMVNGKILYENGNFNLNEDPMDIYVKANEIIESYR